MRDNLPMEPRDTELEAAETLATLGVLAVIAIVAIVLVFVTSCGGRV